MKGYRNVLQFKSKSTRGSISKEKKEVKTNYTKGSNATTNKVKPEVKYQMTKAEDLLIESNNVKTHNDLIRRVSTNSLIKEEEDEDYGNNIKTFKSNGENVVPLHTFTSLDRYDDQNYKSTVDTKDSIIFILNDKVKVMEDKIKKLENCMYGLIQANKAEPTKELSNIKCPMSLRSRLVYPQISRTTQGSRTGSLERKELLSNEDMTKINKGHVNVKTNYKEQLSSIMKRTENILQTYDENTKFMITKLKNKFKLNK